MPRLSLTCVTWNIHRAKGRDGRVDPDRIHRAVESVLAPEKPDVLALQEADSDCPPHAGILDMERIAVATGLTYVHDRPALRWGPESHGFLGTILFLRPGMAVQHADVIDLPGHCHRGAIAVETTCPGGPVRVISTHLSLSQILRAVQMRILGQYLRRRPAMPTILLGDFNEWRPWGGLAFSKQLLAERFRGPSVATFPTRRPLLALDRILCTAPLSVAGARNLDTEITNLASDHRPLIAQVSG